MRARDARTQLAISDSKVDVIVKAVDVKIIKKTCEPLQ